MLYLAISYFIYLLFQLLYIGFRDTYGIPMFFVDDAKIPNGF